MCCCLCYFIAGGVQYISSEGNKAKLESARNKIANAVTGLIILFLLWFILKLINVIFGVNIGGLGIWQPGPNPSPPPATSTPAPSLAPSTPTPSSISCGAGNVGVCEELNYCLNNDGTCISGSCGPMVNPCCCLYSGGPTPTPSGYLNIGTGLSCNQFCAGFGLGCSSHGTDPSGTNSRAVISISNNCTIRYQPINGCADIMTNTGNWCNDRNGNGADPNEYHNTEWTYCNCTGSTPTPTPPGCSLCIDEYGTGHRPMWESCYCAYTGEITPGVPTLPPYWYLNEATGQDCSAVCPADANNCIGVYANSRNYGNPNQAWDCINNTCTLVPADCSTVMVPR